MRPTEGKKGLSWPREPTLRMGEGWGKTREKEVQGHTSYRERESVRNPNGETKDTLA